MVKFNLFDANYNYLIKNFGLPENVVMHCHIERPDAIENVIYELVLKQLLMVPDTVNFIETTNNRQLSIFYRSPVVESEPAEPTLTIKKTPRRFINQGTTYRHKWNPKRWNIADTQEKFWLDANCFFELEMYPLSEFEIKLKIHQRPKHPREFNLKLNN